MSTTNKYYFKQKYDEIAFETQCDALHNILECYSKELDILEYFNMHQLPLTDYFMEMQESVDSKQPTPTQTSASQPESQQPTPNENKNINPTASSNVNPNANNKNVNKKENNNETDNRNIFQKLWDGICKLVKLIGQAFKNFFNTFSKKNEQMKRIQDTLNQMDDKTLNQVEEYFTEISKSETTNESFIRSAYDTLYQEAINSSLVANNLSGVSGTSGNFSTGRKLLRIVTNAILTKKTLNDVGSEIAGHGWDWVIGALNGKAVEFITDQGSKIVVNLALSTLTLSNPIVGVGVDIIMSYLMGKITDFGIKQISQVFKTQPQSIVPKSLPPISGLINAADDLNKTAQSFKEVIYGSLSRNNIGKQMKAQGTYLVHTNLNKSGENMLKQLDDWIAAIHSRNDETGEGQIVNLDTNATPRMDGGLNIRSGKDITQMNQSQLNTIVDCLIASKTWTYSDQSTEFGKKMKEVSNTYQEINRVTDESINPNAKNMRAKAIGLDSDDDMTFRTNFNLMKQHGENCLKFTTDVQTIKKCADQISDVYAVYLAIILAGIQQDKDNVHDNALSNKMNQNMAANGQTQNANNLSDTINDTISQNQNRLTEQQAQNVQSQLNRNLTLGNMNQNNNVRNVRRTLNTIGSKRIGVH